MKEFYPAKQRNKVTNPSLSPHGAGIPGLAGNIYFQLHGQDGQRYVKTKGSVRHTHSG